MTNSTTFYFPEISSTFAVVAPSFSGGISTASSALIIFIIFQSRSRLSKIYHRIMFGMSCADILASVAMALSTLPMPREDLSQELLDHGYEYPPYGGTKLGNLQTCTAQGFFYIFGGYAMVAYNLSLCFYNTCAIALRMQETNIVKYVEPVLHLMPLASGLGMALPLVFGGHYRPTGYDMWCSNWVGLNTLWFYHYVFMPFLAIAFFALIVLCGAMMVGKVYRLEQRLSNARRSANYDRAADSLNNTKVLMFQMALYTLSYIVTLLPSFISQLLHLTSAETISPVLFYLRHILQPLQGLFNALIFINYKIYNYRRSHSGASRCHVLNLLLTGDYEEVIIFSRISVVNYDQHREIMNLELEDENGSTEKVSIENKPPSDVDMFYDEVDGDQGLSGFSQLVPSAVQNQDISTSIGASASRGGLSGFSSNSPSNADDNLQNPNVETFSTASFKDDSEISFSRGSNSIFSWKSRAANNADMSRGGLSGISPISEENV